MTQQLIAPDDCQPVSEAQQAEPAGRAVYVNRDKVPVGVLCLLTAGAVMLYLAPLRSVELDKMTGFGLISVLPVSTLAGLGLLAVGFIGTLSMQRRRAWLLGAQLVLLVLMLHGITVLLESQPRFAISWVHAGFVEFIDRTGTTAPALDARWSWPGIFAIAAFWAGTGHLSALRPILAGAAVVNNLLYLVALGLLMSTIRLSWQARWLAALLFCILNWVGQDYFSPQGETYLLYLLFVGVLVSWFRPSEMAFATTPSTLRRGARLWRRLWGETTPGELPPREVSPGEKVVLLAVLVGLFTAATVSHQLTPLAMVICAVGLVVARRCTLTGLPVLLIVIFMAWVSFMTQSYWTGHLEEILGSVGDVGGTVSSSVVARASEGSAEHQWVVNARMATTGLIFVMACVGLLRRRRRGVQDRVLLVLMTVPITLPLLQDYGGEIALRVYLFALAPACLLGGLAFFPHPTARPSVFARAAAGVCALFLLFTFLVTRYGNEQFERISDGAVGAAESIYEHTSDRVNLLYAGATVNEGVTPFMPLGYRDVERVGWTGVQAPIDPSDVTGLLQALRDRGPSTYLITTRSQEAFVVFGQGYPMDWAERFRRAMAAAPGVRVVVNNRDAAVYTLNWPSGARPAPLVRPATGVEVRRTPWTPVGVAFLVMLLCVLGAREAWRTRLTSTEQRRLRPLTVAAVPLLVGLVLVIVERFILLTS
jgi:hypothetical protein